MTALSETQSRESMRQIATYRRRFGEGHFYLACHAALPLALTPDLLYRLWANFQNDRHDADLNIPWIAVSDLLLSGLCEEVGFELYEMDAAIREACLKQLRNDPHFGLERIRELADFLVAYIEPQLDSLDPDIQDFATAQKWSALAYSNPYEAARTISTALAQLNQTDTIEWIRMATLLETLEEPLFEYRSLLNYAQAIADFSRGNLEGAIHLLSQILTSTNRLQIAQVDLPIPELLKGKLVAPQVSEPQQSRPRIEFLKQYRWLISGGITGSLALASGVFYLSQPNQSPQPTPSVISAAPSPRVTQSVTPSPQPIATPSVTPELPINSTPSPSPTSRSTVESTPASSQIIPSPSPSTTGIPQPTTSPNASTDVPSSQLTNQPENLQSLPTVNSSDTNLPPPPPVNFPPPTSSSTVRYSGMLLQISSRGSAVADLQTRLSAAGYFNGVIDGIFSPQTQAAVIQFQRDQGLIADGVVGSQVYQALNDSSGTVGTIPRPIANSRELTIGSSGSDVENLQNQLEALGYFDASPTGYYGLLTRDAVLRFQAAQRLPQTGIADARTLNQLGTGTIGSIDRVNRYVVVVPRKDETTLAQVRRFFPAAVERESARGAYVEAGRYPNMERASRQADLLRVRGLDVRVAYR
ncbi:peptidoglycan-binding protein [Phormidesmis sp. 146-33]